MSTGSSESSDNSTREEQWESFKALLDEQNDWPTEYVFKFIVPKAGLVDIRSVFDGQEIVVRASTRGNYLSITATLTVSSSEEIVEVYEKAGDVPGVISL